jgi:hypothetical protein
VVWDHRWWPGRLHLDPLLQKHSIPAMIYTECTPDQAVHVLVGHGACGQHQTCYDGERQELIGAAD